MEYMFYFRFSCKHVIQLSSMSHVTVVVPYIVLQLKRNEIVTPFKRAQSYFMALTRFSLNSATPLEEVNLRRVSGVIKVLETS